MLGTHARKTRLPHWWRRRVCTTLTPMTSPFRPHGEFKTHVDGRLIVSDVVGPWNREMVEAWAAELHQRAKLMPPGPHVGIAIVHESILCPPDAFELMGKVIKYAARNLGSLGTIIVADSTVEGRDFMEPSFAKMYRDITPHRFFSDYASAKDWALELLAQDRPA